MPELPEVETVVRTLRPMLVGQTIRAIETFWPKTIEDEQIFREKVIGQRIESITRRGKYILWNLSEGSVVIHLRMEGRFYVHHQSLHQHSHVLFTLDTLKLEYNDSRKFGRISYHPDPLNWLNQKLGPEPFDETCNAAYLKSKARTRHIPLKTFLLDQSVLAGIGNIYADEICFHMKVSPEKSVHRLRLKDFEACVIATQRVLQEAINLGGSSVRSYTSSLGVSGRFQLHIQVYGRAGQACVICATSLVGTRIGQRSSVYCPRCQR